MSKKSFNLDDKFYYTATLGFLFVVIFLLIYMLNLKTPLVADDFSYSFIYNTPNRIHNVWDIFVSQVNHYFVWGGRSIVHFLAQLFLFLGKPTFNIINSFAYLALIYLINIHASYGKKPKISVYIFIWFFVPAWGQNILWLVGSSNYMYGMILILIMLLPYRKYLINLKPNDTFLKVLAMFMMGIISGWTNENTAIAMIIIIALFIIVYKYKNIEISKWSISGLIGSIVGYAIMILAPGNYVRLEHYVDNRSFIIKILGRFIDISKHGIIYLFILATIAIFFIGYNYIKKQKFDIIPYIYLFGAFVAMYSMIMSPTFPKRAWFGVVIYFLIALASFYNNFVITNRKQKILSLCALILSITLFSYSYVRSYFNISGTYDLYVAREKYILEQKDFGNLDIETYFIYTTSKHNGILSDIAFEKDHWINQAVSEYYEINSIVAIDSRTAKRGV